MKTKPKQDTQPLVIEDGVPPPSLMRRGKFVVLQQIVERVRPGQSFLLPVDFYQLLTKMLTPLRKQGQQWKVRRVDVENYRAWRLEDKS